LTAPLKADPFADEMEGPRYIRIDKFLYKFNDKGKGKRHEKEPCWKREMIGRVYPRLEEASKKTLEDNVN
jgi:NH3-dependent NAD+ synthetase